MKKSILALCLPVSFLLAASWFYADPPVNAKMPPAVPPLSGVGRKHPTLQLEEFAEETSTKQRGSSLDGGQTEDERMQPSPESSSAAATPQQHDMNPNLTNGWEVYRVSINESIDNSFRMPDETSALSLFSSARALSRLPTCSVSGASCDAIDTGDVVARDLLRVIEVGNTSGVEQPRAFEQLRAAAVEATDEEAVSLIDTFQTMQERDAWHARRRLVIASKMLSSPNSSVLTIVDTQWLRCMILWMDELAEAAGSERLQRCGDLWATERHECLQLPEHSAIRAVVLYLRESSSSGTPSDVASVLDHLYSSRNVNTRLSLWHASQGVLTPRRLQPVIPQTAEHHSVAAALQRRTQERNFWTTSSVQNIKVPRLHPTATQGFGEGVCLNIGDANGKFQVSNTASGVGGGAPAQSSRLSRSRVRVMLRMDAETTLLFATSRRNDSAEDDAAYCSREWPQNHMTRFMRKSRWMFDSFVPFLDERDALSSTPLDPTRAVPVDAEAVTADISQQDIDAAFRIRASRVVLQKSGSYKLSQLLAPLYYDLTNVCVSPHGYGLSAYAPSTWPAPKIPPELRDERRNKIRMVTVRRRRTRPESFVNKPVFFSVVQYQSDNLGHVMYRVGAQQELLRRTSLNLSARIPGLHNPTPDDFVVGYIVIPNAAGTFGTRSSLRHFYQGWNQSWFSIMSVRKPQVKGVEPSDEEEADEVCFRHALIGHDAVYMYHSVGSSPAMRKRYLQSAAGSQRKVDVFLASLKERLLSCLIHPFQSLIKPLATRRAAVAGVRQPINSNTTLADVLTAPVSSAKHNGPIRIVVIQRRQRRLGNLNQLLAALVLEYGSCGAGGRVDCGDDEGNVALVDALFSGRGIEVLVADFEFLTTAEQTTLVSTADILLGVHGTALQWMFLMHRGAVVIELQYPSLGCVKGAVLDTTSHAAARLFCEFGKTSVAAAVTHIAYMTTDLFGDDAKHRFNVLISRSVFLALIRSALCSLRSGASRAAADCQRWYPAA